MALSACQIVFLCAVGIVLLARPVEAFGAGNIGSTSKVEGQNWRHGDLEDTLLTIVASKAMGGKKFGKLDVKRVRRSPSSCSPLIFPDLLDYRSISATGFATTVKQLMSARSRM